MGTTESPVPVGWLGVGGAGTVRANGGPAVGEPSPAPRAGGRSIRARAHRIRRVATEPIAGRGARWSPGADSGGRRVAAPVVAPNVADTPLGWVSEAAWPFSMGADRRRQAAAW